MILGIHAMPQTKPNTLNSAASDMVTDEITNEKVILSPGELIE